MKTSTILALLSATLAAADNCYHSGAKAYATDIRTLAANVCEGNGEMTGVFGAGETKYACRNVSPSVKLEFWVTNENKAMSIDLGDGDCTFQFKGLVDECNYENVSQGGSKAVAGWRFR